MPALDLLRNGDPLSPIMEGEEAVSPPAEVDRTPAPSPMPIRNKRGRKIGTKPGPRSKDKAKPCPYSRPPTSELDPVVELELPVSITRCRPDCHVRIVVDGRGTRYVVMQDLRLWLPVSVILLVMPREYLVNAGTELGQLISEAGMHRLDARYACIRDLDLMGYRQSGSSLTTLEMNQARQLVQRIKQGQMDWAGSNDAAQSFRVSLEGGISQRVAMAVSNTKEMNNFTITIGTDHMELSFDLFCREEVYTL
jgi:hypothetical protein